jgi:hypothetical protein
MSEELDVQEVRQIIGPNSYDDNFNLIGYTSELRDRDGNFYAFVDFNANHEGKIRECPHCLEYEIHNKLQPRILKKGEIKPRTMMTLFSVMNAGMHFLSMKHTLNLR